MTAAGSPGINANHCRLSAAVCVLLVAVAATACGKKGNPLAPFSDLPSAVTTVTARRVGPQVAFQFTVPARNVDGRGPADLDRIDLYVSTTRLLQPADYLKRGTLVGSVKVRRPPPPAVAGEPPPPPQTGVEQGAVATIIEKVDVSTPVPVPAVVTETADESEALFPDGGGPLLSPRRSQATTRFYVLVPINRRGDRGAQSPVIEVPFVEAPEAPADVEITYTETDLHVSWAEPPVPLRQPIQAVAVEEDALPSRPIVSFAVSSGYNVYQVAPPSAATGAPDGVEPMPVLLNPMPLSEREYEEMKVEFGTERCFVVRTEETVGTAVVESAASTIACITPIDTFPAAAPRSVAGVSSEGAISLIWEPNSEADLKGYLVLRGDAPGDKLQALTTGPITETTYRDTTVQRGVEYVYAVVAVDKADNISDQSNHVLETAR